MTAHKKVRVSKNCIICDKAFECTPYKATRQATCLSDECKKALKFGKHNPFYGREHSKATRDKIGEANSKPRTKVVCACGCGEEMDYPPHRIKSNKTDVFFVNQEHLHTWLRGENHWNYRGGSIYYGDGWLRTAQAVRDRDKVCQECGKTPEENGRNLDVHHKIPARVSQDNSMDNLIALCASCHQKHQVLERYEYPCKVTKYRKCLVCDKVFIPEPFQKFCSEDCKRQRIRQYEQKYLDTHPKAYQAKRQRIKNWQQTNKERVNASHQQARLRRRLKDSQ